MKATLALRLSVVAVALVMIGGSVAIFATPLGGNFGLGSSVAPVSTPSSGGNPVSLPGAATGGTGAYFSSAQVAKDLSPSGVWDAALPIDQAKATAVSNVLASAEASGISSSTLYPPNLYEPMAPPSETGGHIVPTYPYPNAPAPLGLGFYGLSNTSGSLTGSLFNTTGVAGYFSTGDSLGVQSVYFDFGGQQEYGSQLNSVLNNVTLLGQGGYQMWTQNVINYNTIGTSNQFSFDINIWNFSSSAISMSRNSIIYPTTSTGSVYEAGGPPITVSYPFSFALYMNTTVNTTYSNSAGSCVTYGCNELYFNYSVWNSAGQRVCPTPTTQFPTCGTYDNVIFNSQAPNHHVVVQRGSAEYVANGLAYNPYVELPDDFEWDFGIGDSSGSMNNLVYADATLGLMYLNATTGNFQEVPSAYNYGSETGEDGAGAYIGWNTGANGQPYGTMTTGPTLLEGLWNISNVPAGLDAVNYAAVTPGNAFIAYAPGAGVTNQSMFKVAPTFGWYTPHGAIGPNTYLSPGVYTVEVLLSDYDQQSQTITVGAGGVTLSNHLVNDPSVGVYTPLWAFSTSDLANLSLSGNGTAGNPFIMPSNQPGSMSLVFGDIESYLFPVWMGIYLNSTTAYVDFNPPPSLAIDYPSWSILDKVQTYFAPAAASVPYVYQFQMYFYHASNVVIGNAASIGGWFSDEEVGRKYNVYVNDGTNFLFYHDYFNVSSEGLEFLDGGSGNYVWGSTFYPWSDPTAYPGIETPSTGLTVSISGTTVYNNAFYTNGTASSSSSFTNTWNAPGGYQPASNYRIVDGFNLTGSILGGSVQGGNYWFNYGALANPYGILPYGARSTSPTGTKAIGTGGDYAPLATLPGDCAVCEKNLGLYQVTFTATGLTAQSWGVKVLNVPVYEPIPATTYTSIATNTSTTTTMTFWLPNGTYSWIAGPSPTGYAPSPAIGTFSVSGAPVAAATIAYNPGYVVTFTAAGLPTGTTWHVNITGQASLAATTTATGGKTVTITLANGVYTYSATSNNPLYEGVYDQQFTVSGAALGVTVTYTLVTYAVTFTESGLPGGTSWSVTLGASTLSSTGASIAFAESNGTYGYSVATADSSYAPTVYSGSVTVSGAPVSTAVTFELVTYSVSFSESGLPAGDTWYVNVTGGPDLSGTGAMTTLTTSLSNGTYTFRVATNDKTEAPHSSGSVTVNGGAASATITFSPFTYTVTVKETGLPAGTSWSVTIGATTVSGTGATHVFDLTNGSYSYTATIADGGASSGSFSVAGSALTVTVAYHKVTFSETGLPGGTSWHVTTNSVTESSTATTVVFYLVDGTYAYRVGLVSGYHTADNGSLTVVGTSLSVHVPFSETTYKVKFTESGFTPSWKTTWCVTLGATTLCSAPGATSITFSGIPNGTYGYTIGTVANYTLNGGAYSGTLSVSGSGQASLAATVATHWTLVTYSVKFTETGLRSGTSWQLDVDGHSKVTTGKSLTFLIPNGTYAFTASSAGYTTVTGSVTVNGAATTQSVAFVPSAVPLLGRN